MLGIGTKIFRAISPVFFIFPFFLPAKKSRHPTRKILGGNLSAHLPSSLRHGPCDVSPATLAKNRTVRALRAFVALG